MLGSSVLFFACHDDQALGLLEGYLHLSPLAGLPSPKCDHRAQGHRHSQVSTVLYLLKFMSDTRMQHRTNVGLCC